MSIQGLGSPQPHTESRPAAGRAQTAGASFQDWLIQTAAQANPAPPPAADSGRAAFTKNSLLSSLFDLKSAMLERMEQNKEKTEEQQAWEKLMKYLDAWIDSLREETADIEKSARAYAALQAELTKDTSGRKDLGNYLLECLTEFLAN
nr:hypothetical protein [uncultured Oscillibacter sp.]